jgi:hypothetical protein
MKVNFETRCDVLDPSLIRQIAEDCGILAFGLESASYNTLKRMNKVKDRSHYQKYISNAIAIFKEAATYEIPVVIFMIAGYPGDTERDLEESLVFAKELSEHGGPGGHIFKIGECRVYPKTKIYQIASSSQDVVFDDDGVFGQNVVRQPSKDLKFETVGAYMREVFELSNISWKLRKNLLNVMPFFRLPSHALRDNMIAEACFLGENRGIFSVRGESLSTFRDCAAGLNEKYWKSMSGQRSMRDLPI